MAMHNLKKDLHELKKPSLMFELSLPEIQTKEPKMETYFGGKPYITDEKELQVCSACKRNMDFVFQVSIPEKHTVLHTMYSFYYCFKCAHETENGTFAVNIYKNPHEDTMLTEFSYQTRIPRAYVQYNPVYELPEWDLLEVLHPHIADKFEIAYGEKAIEAYFQIQDRVREYFNDTGLKFKGYAETIGVEDIPLCPISGKRMEPFIQMESLPEIRLDWLKKESYLILFKSPDYDEFALRCLDNDYGLEEETSLFLTNKIEYKEDDEDELFDI